MYMHEMSDVSPQAKEIGARCLAVRVLRAGRILTRMYDEALRPTGLTITQFTLLNAIETRRPDSISRLGEILDIDRTTLSRNLSLLEKAGLVHLGKAGARRKRELLLTSRGLDQLREAYPRWRVVQDRLEALFEDGELDDLKAALGKIRP